MKAIAFWVQRLTSYLWYIVFKDDHDNLSSPAGAFLNLLLLPPNKSLFSLSLNLGWLCDWIWQIECARSHVQFLRLGLKKAVVISIVALWGAILLEREATRKKTKTCHPRVRTKIPGMWVGPSCVLQPQLSCPSWHHVEQSQPPEPCLNFWASTWWANKWSFCRYILGLFVT